MPPKSKTDIETRLDQLQTQRKKGGLSLRESAEFDCICTYGLEGWTDWVARHEEKQG